MPADGIVLVVHPRRVQVSNGEAKLSTRAMDSFAQLLGEGPLARPALDAALGLVDREAFIATLSGEIVHANALGRRRLALGRRGLRDELRAAIRAHVEQRSAVGRVVVPLRCDGSAAFFLVAYQSASSVADLAAHWGLTSKQVEVVALLANGLSNKEIASQLGCSERTVETHLTSIFAKAGVAGRTALVAAVGRIGTVRA